MHFRTPLLAIAAATLVAACESKPAPPAEAPAAVVAASLYDRLGGTPAITSLVDAFVGNVAADTRINARFARVASDTAAMRQFKQTLVDHMCAGTGGPCTYAGRDMKTAHAGMGITDADFAAVVEDLVTAMNGAGVPQAEQDELLAILGPMKADIVAP
jgi:hemoglobin